ncbi:hypothetical protein [Algoriphagus sediminis]|uniref:LTD domain-containing protein n=1 Tax=Algoriphagus sediminis TaxID=3057113 RepID=A0ABT7YFB6_9BACT|nr:hypothetical protein [Algoriphagus sediminis]MDN3205216.1 hypothetical protein [Algoriphagus sediminis]
MFTFLTFWLTLWFFALNASDAETNLIAQNFEEDFSIQSTPQEFLPDWSGNEVRDGSSRIFQVENLGRDGSRALAVQPISTFNGELLVKLDLRNFEDPSLFFFAKSVQNGSGNRSAEVYYSFGLDGDFSDPIILGGPEEFKNEDQDFRKFELEIPEELRGLEIHLKLSILYGEGSGTAARWIMDDFSYGDFVPDTDPPVISEVRGFDSDEIEIRFSEPIDPVFSQILINYKLDGLEPNQVVLKEDSVVNLRFDQSLEEGKNYELFIQSISDLEGSESQNLKFDFQFFDPTDIPKKALVINELMPAPRSGNDLPNVEYLELFHAGEKLFRIDSISIQVGERIAILPEFWIDPNELVLLVPQGSQDDFLGLSKVIPLESWPTLLNSGATINLKNGGRIIDKISYSNSSWADSELASGGYSLEVVNPFLACDQSELLRPSIDPFRGTPGRENSVLNLSPDEEAPTLRNFGFLNETAVFFEFNEPISQNNEEISLLFSGGIKLDSVEVSGSLVTFYSETPFVSNQIYQVDGLEVSDCAGIFFDGPFPFEIIFPRKAQIGEVLINEILFNPISGEPKFVELANRTNDYLEIGDWFLANEDDMGEPDNLKMLSDDGLILFPEDFIAITEDTVRLRAGYLEGLNGNLFQIPSLPSYPISGGTVRVLDSQGQSSDRFTFSEDLHHPLLRDPKGVSLERISLNQGSDNVQNWQSAAESQGFATPGRENSQAFEAIPSGELISIDPEVFDPEGTNGQTFTNISFSLDEPGWVGSFKIYDLNGRLIQPLAENALLGTNGFYTWTGIDQTGNRVPVGYYILLVELFNPNGETFAIKKTIVIAQKL